MYNKLFVVHRWLRILSELFFANYAIYDKKENGDISHVSKFKKNLKF